MFTYIRKQHNGYYFDTPNKIDEALWEGQIGTTYEDFLNNKWILLSLELVNFHNEHKNASIRDVIKMSLTPAPAITLELAKEIKIKLIDAYNQSDEVNSFTINNVLMWLTVEERQQIATLINVNQAVGRETMTRWYNGTKFTFQILLWQQMLIALEIYAGDALNVTEVHKAAVNALETIEAIDEYDYKTGYPEKLVFSSGG